MLFNPLPFDEEVLSCCCWLSILPLLTFCWFIPPLALWYWLRLFDWEEALCKALVHAAAAAWAEFPFTGFCDCCCCQEFWLFNCCWFQFELLEEHVSEGEVDGEIEFVELLDNLLDGSWIKVTSHFMNNIRDILLNNTFRISNCSCSTSGCA